MLSPAAPSQPDPPPPSLAALRALWHARRFAELEPAVRRYLDAEPNDAEGWSILGSALRHLGRAEEAVACHRRSLALCPDNFATLLNLGNALNDADQPDEAVEVFRRCIAQKPDDPAGYFRLGLAFNKNRDWDQAIAAFAEAIRRKPDYAEAYNDLGLALGERGEYGNSVAAFVEALRHDRELDHAYLNLGLQLFLQGRHAESWQARQVSVARQPTDVAANRAYLNLLNYLTEFTPSQVFDAHKAAYQRLLPVLLPPQTTWPNARDPERRLKVGYVSADFFRHSCAWFLDPLLRNHDRGALEVFCYSNVAFPDWVTDGFRGTADCWRDVRKLDDAAMAELIRSDAIDILVDCCGWTVDARLAVFHARPAPIQVTWLGYPNTTGFPTIQYRLTDALADPPGQADALNVERLVRLPQGFLCYAPLNAGLEVEPPPMLKQGHVTFGSFNVLSKLNDATIALWAGLLGAVPNSRLLLKSWPLSDPPTAELIRARFARHGIPAERLDLRAWAERTDHHLALYGEVDIGLDPFPYNGTTTTCEALWMGVPVVTLEGDRHAGRVGVSLLHQVGHPELIAKDSAGYIAIAAGLACDPARMADLRRNLRGDMARSSLCDASGFARRVETAYRDMWRAWCSS